MLTTCVIVEDDARNTFYETRRQKMFERKKIMKGENGSVDRNQLCSFKKNVFYLSSPNHILKRVGETIITRTVSLIETNTKMRSH